MVGKGDKEREVGVKLKSSGGAYEEGLYKRIFDDEICCVIGINCFGYSSSRKEFFQAGDKGFRGQIADQF